MYSIYCLFALGPGWLLAQVRHGEDYAGYDLFIAQSMLNIQVIIDNDIVCWTCALAGFCLR